MSKREGGSVLAVTLLICGILGLLMGAYLMMVKSQNRSVARAQAWNSAMVVAEAGVEEAMAHLNSGVMAPNLALNSWQAVSPPGTFRKITTLGKSYSEVLIKVQPAVTNTYPLIISTGYAPAPISTQKVSRVVQVMTQPRPEIDAPAAMVVSTTVDFNGFNITTDSFDSANTNYSTAGRYDPAKALDNGDVVSLSSAPDAVQIGNAKVKGDIHTAPGGGATILGGGSVGDKAWVEGGKTGIQPGHFADDVDYSFPDAALPPSAYWLSPIPGNYTINGKKYKYVLNGAAPWKLSSLDGGVYVNDVAGQEVMLYVTDSIALGSKMEIRIAENTKFKMYMGGAAADISGGGIVNESGMAKNFTYYGLPTHTALKFGAQAAFAGLIYAPQAVFTLGGGGNNTFDFVGASITKAATMNGHYNFHYDQGLPKTMGFNGYVAKSWDEIYK